MEFCCLDQKKKKDKNKTKRRIKNVLSTSNCFQSKILTAAPLIFRLANGVDKTNKPFVLKSA